jgi:adenylate cyclase 2
MKPLAVALLSVACVVCVTILIALQFPYTMTSPWTAMIFAACVTSVLGSTAIVAGDEIASLPLYALIMVSFETKIVFEFQFY